MTEHRHHPTWAEIKPTFMQNLVPPHATCAICRWWYPLSSAAKDAYGHCHFNPPTADGWPLTNGDEDVCACWSTDYAPVERTVPFVARAA